MRRVALAILALGVGCAIAPPDERDAPVVLVLADASATAGASRRLGEQEKWAEGALLRVNANFDEGNRARDGAPLEDFLPDAEHGARIVPDDPDLLRAEVRIGIAGRWRLSFPVERVNVFAPGLEAWRPIAPGESFEAAAGARIPLRLEGVEGSVRARDVVLRVELETGAGATFVDAARATVVKTEFVLSFDDGPFAEKTLAVARALSRQWVGGRPVRAAFFQVGEDGSGGAWWDVFAHGIEGARSRPEVTRALAAAGHLVGNHTQHHKSFLFSSRETVAEELRLCEATLAGVLGAPPEKVARTPYWTDSEAIEDAARDLGYVLAWGDAGFGDTSGSDWRTIAENTVADYLEGWNVKAEPARRPWPAVVCYHEYHEAVHRNIGEIVNHLRDRGFVLASFDPRRLRRDKSDYR